MYLFIHGRVYVCECACVCIAVTFFATVWCNSAAKFDARLADRTVYSRVCNRKQSAEINHSILYKQDGMLCVGQNLFHQCYLIFWKPLLGEIPSLPRPSVKALKLHRTLLQAHILP
jgi:hypothetical protein